MAQVRITEKGSVVEGLWIQGVWLRVYVSGRRPMGAPAPRPCATGGAAPHWPYAHH